MALSLVYWQQYTNDSVKLARKSEAAVEAGRVLKFLFDTDTNLIIAYVQASMKDKSYKIEVHLDEKFFISKTACECPLANYKCHHVAAALLYGYRHVSKTDVKCSWLKHPKSAMRGATQSMPDLYPPKKPDYRALSRPFNEDDRQFLHQQLGNLGRFTGLHWILSPEPPIEEPIIPLVEDLLISAGYINSPSPLSWLRRELIVSPDNIHKVERKTIGQRDNALWSAIRKHRFTSSNFGVIIAALKRQRLTQSLQKRLLSSYNLERVPAIQWGIAHEQTAIKCYETMGAVVDNTGIWLHESGVLAASPDGTVRQGPGPRASVHHRGLGVPEILEVKCPYTSRNTSVLESAKSNKDFCLGVDDRGSLFLKQNHNYYHQVQGQLHVCGKTICDFVVWTLLDCQVVRVQKNPDWAGHLSKMLDFYFQIYIPSICSS